MARVQVMVSLSDGADTNSTVSGLKSAGLSVEQVHAELGVISGSCDEGSVDRLRAVAGVGGVERAREVQLPKPDSSVQ